MKPRNAEAARLEADYLARVQAAIAGREPSEIDEIVESVRDHIEEELADAAGEQISLVQMANVLEELGPPEAYAHDGAAAPTAKTPIERGAMHERPRLSKLAIASALCLPGSALVAAIVMAIAGGARSGADALIVSILAVLAIGAILGIAALVSIRASGGALRGVPLAWFGIVVGPALVFCWLLVSF